MWVRKYNYDLPKFIEIYNKYQSLTLASAELGMSLESLRQFFINNNFEYKKQVVYKCNHNYFSNLTPGAMYWAGFLAADGNVDKKKNRICLALATKDKNHIEKFKKDLGLENPIIDSIRTDNRESFKQAEYYNSKIRFTSKQIAQDLKNNFNITPAKSKTYQFPEHLKDHPNLHHFIRGLIDGDGWIYNSNSTTIGFCGHAPVVEFVYKFLQEKFDLHDQGAFLIKKDSAGIFNFATFNFCKLSDLKKIINYLYQDCQDLYLERKYQVAQSILLLEEVKISFDPEYMKLRYNELKDIELLAKEFDCSYGTIRRRLEEFNIERIPYVWEPNKEYNFDFFSDADQSEIKYYWTGFLARKFRKYSSGDYIQMKLSDKNIIDNFIKDSKMNLRIEETIVNTRIDYQIIFANKDILEQLNKFNINKEYIDNYQIPKWITGDNLRHFIRGMMDAQSNLYKRDRLEFSIHGTEALLQQLSDIFKSKVSVPLTPKVKPDGNNSYKIKYLANQAKAILHWLYQDATIYLPKKYEITMRVK